MCLLGWDSVPMHFVCVCRLVDSKDIVELQLKQLGCELIIRKKEAVPQPLAAMPAVTMHPPPQLAAMPSQFPPPASPSTSLAPSPAAAVAPTSAPSSAPKPPKSSHPPLKSPMAGTFYRSPGPGLAPFVKVINAVKFTFVFVVARKNDKIYAA